jgi:hypothetical protein
MAQEIRNRATLRLHSGKKEETGKMCQVCGCAEYLQKRIEGKKVIIDRAVDLIRKLGVTTENLSLFEDGEYICGLLGPRVSMDSEAAEIWDVVQTMHRCHERIHQEERKKALEAARDVFSHIPGAASKPRETLILYHQLEQLHREVSDSDLEALGDPAIRDVFRGLRKVHDNGKQRKYELTQKYGL